MLILILKAYIFIGLCFAAIMNISFIYLSKRTEDLEDVPCKDRKRQNDLYCGRNKTRLFWHNLAYVFLWPFIFIL